jgi:hypothetical protein
MKSHHRAPLLLLGTLAFYSEGIAWGGAKMDLADTVIDPRGRDIGEPNVILADGGVISVRTLRAEENGGLRVVFGGIWAARTGEILGRGKCQRSSPRADHRDRHVGPSFGQDAKEGTVLGFGERAHLCRGHRDNRMILGCQ